MNKQKNQIIILAAVIGIGLLYAYMQYLFIPQWATLKEKSAHVTERQAYLTHLVESYKLLSTLKEEVVDLEAQASILDKKVPKKLDKPDIMLTIYSMAKKNGLTPKSLGYEAIQDEGTFLSMPLTFSCSGPQANVYTLLQQFMNNNKYIFALDSISFSPGNEETTTTMRIVAYAYK